MDCPICHEEFTQESDIILVKHRTDTNIEQSRKRRHYYHRLCMNQWMAIHPCCPMDRDDIKTLYRVKFFEICSLDTTAKYYHRILNEIKITDKMITNVTDINGLDEDGKSLAYCACQRGNYSLVMKLLKRGANFQLADENGFTPLMAAVANNYYEIVKKLLLNRSITSRIDQTDKYGKNAFDYACENNCLTIIRTMFDLKLVSHHQVITNLADYGNQFQNNLIFGKEIMDMMYQHIRLSGL